MIVTKNISLKEILLFAGQHFIWLFAHMLAVTVLYQIAGWHWLTIPFGGIVGWIYVVMELIGDYSENPFVGLGTDIPMLSICRTIEIDLLRMLEETDFPKPIQPVNDVLM